MSGRQRQAQVIEELLPHFASPVTSVCPLRIDPRFEVERTPAVGLVTATLSGPEGQDPSEVRVGVWHALGRGRPRRTLAQLTNVAVPIPELYETVWRRRSLTVLSRREFPVQEEIDEMIEAIGEPEGAFVVDLGCSEGLYARHLARLGARVAGVDHSRPFLRRMLHHCARNGVRVAAIRALAEHLPIGERQADAVVVGGSLNEFADRAAALAEVHRVLRPGGRLFLMGLVAAPTRAGRVAQTAARPTGLAFPTAEATVSLCEEARLTVKDTRLDGAVLRLTAERIT